VAEFNLVFNNKESTLENVNEYDGGNDNLN